MLQNDEESWDCQSAQNEVNCKSFVKDHVVIVLGVVYVDLYWNIGCYHNQRNDDYSEIGELWSERSDYQHEQYKDDLEDCWNNEEIERVRLD
jgi:hypothetical protein